MINYRKLPLSNNNFKVPKNTCKLRHPRFLLYKSITTRLAHLLLPAPCMAKLHASRGATNYKITSQNNSENEKNTRSLAALVGQST